MRKSFVIVCWILLLTGCKKTNSGSTGGSNPNPGGSNTAPAPTKATLTFPDQNGLCISGTDLSDSFSTVTFTWSAGSNTDSYDLNLKNLNTSVSTVQSTSQSTLSMSLQKNTPYSWYIISKSGKSSTTAQSDTWKFYNAGKGIISYAPFPAEITSPAYGEMVVATGGTINLTWQGSSVIAGTIASYDIYLGITKTPGLLQASVSNSFLNNVTVSSNSTYYWKVITRDHAGNTSDSGLSQFSVQ